MNIHKKKTDYELSQAEDAYIDKKIEQITKLVSDVDGAICEIEVAKDKHNSGNTFYAEINLTADTELFRATATAETVEAAFDEAKDDLLASLRKKKDKSDRERKKIGARMKEWFRFGK